MPVKVYISSSGFLRISPKDIRIESNANLLYADHNLTQIRKLIERNENPNYNCKGELTPFQTAIAISEDNVAVIRELIKAGADVNFADCFLGLTPLHYAVKLGKLRVTDVLLKSGAYINAKDLLGKTPLHHAVIKYYYYPNLRIIQRLLDCQDIDCDAVDSDGNTALMLTVKKAQSHSVVALLLNKANPNICNKDLETPLHVALASYFTPIENVLLLHGACIYTADKHGHTPMETLIMHLETGLRSISIDIFVKVKLLAFKYCLSQELKRKLLKCNPGLSDFFHKCCEEVDRMRSDYISRTVTVYDFVSKEMMEDHSDDYNLLLHKLVLQRLTLDLYPEYFYDMLKIMPRSSLFAMLETYVPSKNMTIVFLVSDWLSDFDIFRLILAFSNVRITESMRNLDVREILAIHKS